MAATVNVNGRVFDQEHAVISVFDHGFLYGEGVYETLRTYNGQPFLFERHMLRLRRSADMLALGVPLTDAEIDARFRDTMRTAGLGDGADGEAYLRILVTRGIGELTYDPTACPTPSVIVIAKRPVSPPAEGFDRGANGAARTPPLDAGLLPGITREFLFDVGREAGITVREAVLRDADLFGADESFLTSTTREVVPIVQVDDRTIGSGRPGPVTRSLLDGYRRKAESMTR